MAVWLGQRSNNAHQEETEELAGGGAAGRQQPWERQSAGPCKKCAARRCAGNRQATWRGRAATRWRRSQRAPPRERPHAWPPLPPPKHSSGPWASSLGPSPTIQAARKSLLTLGPGPKVVLEPVPGRAFLQKTAKSVSRPKIPKIPKSRKRSEKRL
jgi:hypothetical protein